ncbi:hypothetical protein F4779DRAFT_620293 [Xylariaceae sp. FL0662B]|nr:hypothetical protein F4779DRAFT_620293 [Xylariaceae sp. FL0662B]
MAKDEYRRSFGIGGAGNIRTWEESVVHDIAGENSPRRRSSFWSIPSSSNSNEEQRSLKMSESFKNLFGSFGNRSSPRASK